MTVYRCQECGKDREVTDGRLEYDRGETRLWCPRCVARTTHEEFQEVAQ